MGSDPFSFQKQLVCLCHRVPLEDSQAFLCAFVCCCCAFVFAGCGGLGGADQEIDVGGQQAADALHDHSVFLLIIQNGNYSILSKEIRRNRLHSRAVHMHWFIE